MLDQLKPILNFLERHCDIRDINLVINEGSSNYKTWEQINKCLLPNDLKNFYQIADGFSLTWAYAVNESSKLPLGNMAINSISKLKRVFPFSKMTSFKVSELYDHQDDSEDHFMRFDDKHMIYELSNCIDYEKVVLVIKRPDLKNDLISTESSSCICFIDRGLRVHSLADNFSSYFNLMMAHLGLPQWQYAFAGIGLPPQARLWLQMFCPTRLRIDENIANEDELSREFVDVRKVFKENTDKKMPEKSSKKKLSVSHLARTKTYD